MREFTLDTQILRDYVKRNKLFSKYGNILLLLSRVLKILFILSLLMLLWYVWLILIQTYLLKPATMTLCIHFGRTSWTGDSAHREASTT
jgi:hypothetical protein